LLGPLKIINTQTYIFKICYAIAIRGLLQKDTPKYVLTIQKTVDKVYERHHINKRLSCWADFLISTLAQLCTLFSRFCTRKQR